MVSQLSEDLEIGRKVKLQSALFQIVVLDPQERIVEFRIHRLNVFGRQLFVQHALVERQRESRVDESSVIQSLLSCARTQIKKQNKRIVNVIPASIDPNSLSRKRFVSHHPYHGDESTDKLEIVQVIGIDVGRWIDLKAVVILVGVFKEAVHGI